MQDNKSVTSYRQTLRGRILDASMKAFAAQGIRAVRMDDIAQSLGISKRTLYEIYENKEVLLLEGLKKYRGMHLQNMAMIAASSKNVLDILIKAYRMKVEEFKMTSPQFYVDILKYPSVVNYLHQTAEESHRDFITFLQRGVDEGYFRSDVDLELVAMMFNSITEYITSHELYRRYPFEKLFHDLVFVSLRGLCTPNGVIAFDRYFTQTL